MNTKCEYQFTVTMHVDVIADSKEEAEEKLAAITERLEQYGRVTQDSLDDVQPVEMEDAER